MCRIEKSKVVVCVLLTNIKLTEKLTLAIKELVVCSKRFTVKLFAGSSHAYIPNQRQRRIIYN